MNSPTSHRAGVPSGFVVNIESLRSQHAINEAVIELTGLLHNLRYAPVTPQFICEQNVLEIVYSISENPEPLSQRILNLFPNVPNTFPGSHANKLLSRLSLFLHFLPPCFSQETSESLRHCRSSVEMSPSVLTAISSLSFDNPIPAFVPEDDEFEEDEIFLNITLPSRRKQKRNKFPAAVDMKLFENFGIDVPSTLEEVQDIASRILADQKDILKYYLSVLRRPETVAAIKATYLSSRKAQESRTNSQEGAADFAVAPESRAVEIPSAFPNVQPMKAALYFESAEGFGEWRVLISTRADRDLREARRTDARKFRTIVKKIKQLSNGHFSDDNQKRLNGSSTDIPIYEAKMTRDLRLVYQVDCVPDYNIERQAIRIFGIYTHAQLDKRLWESMSQQLSEKGKEYKRRCVFRNRPYHAGDNVIAPATFPTPTLSPPLGVTRPPLDLPQDHLAELHNLLALEKFVSFSQAFLNSIIANEDVAHVFEVSSQEREIIEHPYSCYVVGRSGTGKTTTMLFKMLGLERAWAILGGNGPKPRQLFVTQSRVLAEKVEEYFMKLQKSLAIGSYSLQELAEMAKTRKDDQGADMMVDRDDDVNWKGDLPDRFSELEDEHFPLFLNFDRLCKMLESDIVAGTNRELSLEDGEPDTSPETPLEDHFFGHEYYRNRGMVSYDTFFESYWPHFPQSAIKGLDPALVYSEFLGVIKGSEEALSCPGRCLGKDDYGNLSFRTKSTFADQRNTIYTIFKSYLRRKRERNEYDPADRTHLILEYLQRNGARASMIDYLYVDEAQDNLLIDALLLRSICRNPGGLFWAGDTAQTIFVGSSFRFDDLKAFLFRISEQNRPQFSESYIQPKSFQLATNYRSHRGIVNCAHSVIQLIEQFWPDSIDSLRPEVGVVDGLRPVFLGGWDQDSVRYEQFLFGASGSHIEFGAHQCILVRDDAARDRLREQVGDIGLIMTLYESKGLEFNDVMLYNFFHDSLVDLPRWRVVLHGVGEKPLSGPAPRFDEMRHAGVRTELKFLYVAITRARKNMWIVDNSEKSEPMRELWSSKGLVQFCNPGDVPHLAVSSTPEEWAQQGHSLFQKKRFLQAKHCFERASLHREEDIADAHYLRERARATPTGPRSDATRSAAFRVAASAFVACAASAKNERNVYHRIAAECYSRSGDDAKAAESYENATELTLAIQHYRKAGLFDDAVRIIEASSEDIDKTVAEQVLNVARLQWFREHKLEKAAKLFSSADEALEFTDDYDLDVARASLLVIMGRISDAAQLHLAEGRVLDAIQLLLQDRGNVQYMTQAKQHLLKGLWDILSFGVSPEVMTSDSNFSQLLDLTTQLNRDVLAASDLDEAEMFRIIKSRNNSRLQELGLKFYSVHKNNVAALLCLDNAFVNTPPIQVAKTDEVSRQLERFEVYVQLLKGCLTVSDPCNKPSIQKLFGFQASAEHVFLLRPGSFLHQSVTCSRIRIARSGDNGITIYERDLELLLKEALGNRLRARVAIENETCHKAQCFSPCLTYVISGSCNRPSCPQEHISASALDLGWYNARVRLHLQQIKICHSLHSLPRIPSERERVQRYWLERLYDAINPPFYKLGTAVNLSSALRQDRGFVIVKEWIRDILLSLSTPATDNQRQAFLTTLLKAAKLAFIINKSEAPGYIYHPRFIRIAPDNAFVRDDGKGYIVSELVGSLHGADPHSISVGIRSLNHIIRNHLPININVLCDLIDHVCGSLILAHRKWQHFHNTTLPRSWILDLANSVRDNSQKHTGLSSLLYESLAELVNQLYRGSNSAAYLLFERVDIVRVSSVIRTVFLARICRTICLLGYHFKYEDLRNKIVRSMKSLSWDRRTIHTPYTLIKTWQDLARVVRQSTMESPMDEMIHISHKDRFSGVVQHFRGIRPIIIKDVYDINIQIDGVPSLAHHSNLRASAPVFVSNVVQPAVVTAESPSKRTTDGPAEEHTVDRQDEENEGEYEESDDEEPAVDPETEASAYPADSSLTQKHHRQPSEEEVAAAKVILSAFRQHRYRRQGHYMTRYSAARDRLFTDCWKVVQEQGWQHGYYRALFLGPLPHLLLCLQEILSLVYADKVQKKKRMKKVKHQELEDVMEQITAVNHLVKDANSLRQELGPKSKLHLSRNVERFKVHVRRVEELFASVRRIHGEKVEELQKELDIAVKGILIIRQPQKKQKPVLNVEDL